MRKQHIILLFFLICLVVVAYVIRFNINYDWIWWDGGSAGNRLRFHMRSSSRIAQSKYLLTEKYVKTILNWRNVILKVLNMLARTSE